VQVRKIYQGNEMDFSNKFSIQIQNEIVKYVENNASQSFPVTATNLWEHCNNLFKESFESNDITQIIFFRTLIFVTDRGRIRNAYNVLADPTVSPDNTFYC